ncbi:MAG: LamG-like jellyroll fold domain-containing protein [Candidatus Shapirobacteria bacterium]
MNFRQLATIIILFFLFPSFIAKKAYAANRTWDGGGGANTNWSTAANWLDNTVPLSGDAVIFDGTSSNNSTIDASFAGTITSLSINAGYGGTITQERSLTTSGGFTQSAGTYTAAAQSLTVNASLTLNGGSLTASSVTTTIGGSLALNGGIFSHNSGNIVFSTTNSTTITCTAGPLNTISISKANSSIQVTISANCIVNFPSADPSSTGAIINNGTVNITGNWSLTGDYTANVGSSLAVTGTTLSARHLVLTGGVFPQGITDITLGGNLTNTANLLPNGTNLILNGSVNSTLNCGTATFSSLTISKAGYYDVNISNNCAFSIAGTNPTSTGKIVNSGNLTVTGNWTVNGSYQSETGGQLSLSGTDLTLQRDLVINGGSFPASKNIIFSGNSSTVLTCANATFNSVSLSHGWNYTISISAGCTVPLSGTNPTISGGVTNNGSIGATGNLTIDGGYIQNSGASLQISGTSLSIGHGNLTLSGGSFPQNITTISVENGVVDNSQSLIPNGVDLTLTGSSTNNISCGNANFNSITLNRTVGGITPVSNCNIGNLTITTGVINNSATAYSYNITGNYSQASPGSVGGSNLTLAFTGSLAQTISKVGGTLASPLQINKTGSNALSLSTPLTTTSTCTVTEGIFNLNGQLFTCGSTFTIEDGGTLTLFGSEIPTTPTLDSGSNVIYKGNGGENQNVYKVKAWNYSNLTINPTNSQDIITSTVTDYLPGATYRYWKFDDGVGTSTVDSSGNSVNGVLQNMEADDWNSSIKATLPFTNGYSLAFDGSTSEQVVVSDAIDPTAYTICAWVRPSDVTSTSIIIRSGAVPTTTYQDQILIDSNSKFEYYSYDGASVRVVGTSTVVANQWHHVCVSAQNNGQAKLYVNGVSEGTPDTVGTLATTADRWAIGSNSGGSMGWYAGYIDDVRVYNTVLSDNQIYALSDIGPSVISAITVGGNFTITSGTFISPTTFNIAGNWSNTGLFTHNNGSVVFTGGNQEISGSNTFYNFTKNVTSAYTLTLPGDLTKTQTFAGTLDLRGIADHLLTLNSSLHQTQAKIDPQSTRSVQYLAVHDINNINSTSIPVLGLNVTDLGNNTGWGFNQAPQGPTSLGPAGFINGNYSGDTTPTLEFTLSDPDSADTVKYLIEIDDSSNYSSPLISYTSDLAPQGSTSFTVSQDQALPEGQYYWRVKAVDNNDNQSSFTTASIGDSPAFIIDNTAPTNPGNPSTTSPTNQTTQTWSWSSATDALSGIAFYLWRITDNLGNALTNGTTALSSLTSNLTQGIFSLFVKSQDNVGHQSSESPGSLVVDTTAPVTTSSGTDTSWHDTPVTVTLECSDTGGSTCANTYYTTNGANPTTSSSIGTTIVLSADGVYTIKYFSKDTAGNSESIKTAANTVKIDTTPPTPTPTQTPTPTPTQTPTPTPTQTPTPTSVPTSTPTQIPTPTQTPTETPTPTPTSSIQDVGSNTSGSVAGVSINQAPTCNNQTPGSKAPHLYGASANNQNSITLYFSGADLPFDHYDLSFGLKSGEYSFGATNLPKDISQYQANNLSSNTTYYFKIRPGNGCATGNWSNEISATTMSNISLNQIETTALSLETIPPKPNPSPTPSSNPSPSPPQPADYQLQIKVVDNLKKPIVGAQVTIHSKTQKAYTDGQGIARFTNVEPGNHRVLIAYNDYQGEQSLFLTGNIPQVDINISIKLNPVSISRFTIIITTSLSLIIVLLVVYILKQKNKFKN